MPQVSLVFAAFVLQIRTLHTGISRARPPPPLPGSDGGPSPWDPSHGSGRSYISSPLEASAARNRRLRASGEKVGRLRRPLRAFKWAFPPYPPLKQSKAFRRRNAWKDRHSAALLAVGNLQPAGLCRRFVVGCSRSGFKVPLFSRALRRFTAAGFALSWLFLCRVVAFTGSRFVSWLTVSPFRSPETALCVALPRCVSASQTPLVAVGTHGKTAVLAARQLPFSLHRRLSRNSRKIFAGVQFSGENTLPLTAGEDPAKKMVMGVDGAQFSVDPVPNRTTSKFSLHQPITSLFSNISQSSEIP